MKVIGRKFEKKLATTKQFYKPYETPGTNHGAHKKENEKIGSRRVHVSTLYGGINVANRP